MCVPEKDRIPYHHQAAAKRRMMEVEEVTARNLRFAARWTK